jgi:hypothetical protein
VSEHLRERGVWYAVGFAIYLLIVVPGIHRGLGWSLGFLWAMLTVFGIGVASCAVVFGLWMLTSKSR